MLLFILTIIVFIIIIFVFFWLFFCCGLEVLLFFVRRGVEEVVPAVLSAADELREAVRLLSSCRAPFVRRIVDFVGGLLPFVPSVWDSNIVGVLR